MPQYRADVWLGSASGRQEITVSANTGYGAKEQIMNIYDVEENDIRNLRQVSGGGSSGGSSEGLGSLIAIGLVLLLVGQCSGNKSNNNAPQPQTQQEVQSSQ